MPARRRVLRSLCSACSPATSSSPGCSRSRSPRPRSVSDPERAAATLRRLSRRGVKISLDDFGVGYTSLSQLDHLPIDELKIDRQFVAGLAGGRDSGAVVRAVVSIGHELGMTVVAEGVEDRATIREARVARL